MTLSSVIAVGGGGVIGPGLKIRSKEGLSVEGSGSGGGARLWFRDQISLETVSAAQKQGNGDMRWGEWEP